MPAYYASLPLSLALTLAGGARLGFPHLTASQAAFHLLTHVTMTYTLFPSTFYSLNGVYWSLGLEWQLYLALPLLIWGSRRFGLRKTATAAILCNVAYRLLLGLAIDHGLVARGSLLATAVLPNQLPGRWAEFVLGMIAADLYVTGRVGAWAGRARYVVPVLIPLGVVAHDWPLGHIVFGCVFFGLVCMVLVSTTPISKVFSWPPLVAIGTMSYSVYLVHQLVIEGLVYVVHAHSHASATATFVILVLLLPLILLAAWALFITVERYTLGTRPALGSRVATAILFPEVTFPAWRPLQHPGVRTR
jgi:peptidoglycan/LPS O-acetylase OafA/YrhL